MKTKYSALLTITCLKTPKFLIFGSVLNSTTLIDKVQEIYFPKWMSTLLGIREHSQKAEVMSNLMTSNLWIAMRGDLYSHVVRDRGNRKGQKRYINLCGIMGSLCRGIHKRGMLAKLFGASERQGSDRQTVTNIGRRMIILA